MKAQLIEAMESASDYLFRIGKIVPEIVNEYRTGDTTKASSDMILLSEGLQWLTEALSLTSNLHNVNYLEIKETYFEFVEALENDDSVLIADLLEYELIPQLQQWKSNLDESIAKHAN